MPEMCKSLPMVQRKGTYVVCHMTLKFAASIIFNIKMNI